MTLTLPHFTAQTAERQFLAWALQRNEWFDDAPVALGTDDFEASSHGALFAAIGALRARREVAKPDQLEQWCQGREDWTVTTLYTLMSEGRGGTFAEFEANARTISDTANKRLLALRLSDAISHLSENQTEDGGVLFSRIESLFRATDLRATSSAIALADIGDRYLARVNAGEAQGFRTGYRDIDARHGSFAPGELIIVAGETASGKTTFATNLARRWAGNPEVMAPDPDRRGEFIRQPINDRPLKGHFASYEMGDAQLVPRMWSAISYAAEGVQRFEYTKLRHRDHDVAAATLQRCQGLMREKYATLHVDVTPPQTLAELEASVRQTRKALGGLDFIIVDYLHLMRAANSRIDRHLQIAEITSGLKAMAQRLKVVIVALGQINRENNKRTDKRPQRSDMRESASIEQDADVILAVYRPAREVEIELQAKQDDPTVDDETFMTLDAKLEKLKDKLEVLTLKARQGPEGVDHLRVLLGYDTILDGESPLRLSRAKLRRAA